VQHDNHKSAEAAETVDTSAEARHWNCVHL
jgi:hypothetical protein